MASKPPLIFFNSPCISPPFHWLFAFVQLRQSVHASRISEPKEGERIKISSPAHIKEKKRTEKVCRAVHCGLVRDPAAERGLLNEQHDTPELHVELLLRLPTWKPSGGGNGKQGSDISQGARNILRTQRDFHLICMQSHDYTGQLWPDVHTAIRVQHVMRTVSHYELTGRWKDFHRRTDRNPIHSDKWSLVCQVTLTLICHPSTILLLAMSHWRLLSHRCRLLVSWVLLAWEEELQKKWDLS